MPAPSAALYPSTIDDDTSLFKLSDRKSFSLNGGISDTALSLTVNESCSGLTGNFYLAFATGEIIYVTAVNTSTKVMTITRGASGTSPTTHNTAEGLKMIVTAQIFEQFKRVFLAIEGELGTLAKSTFSNVAARIADAERRIRYHTHDGTTDYGPRIDADTVDTFHATATPTASRVVVADGGGKVDGWVSTAAAGTAGKVSLASIAEVNTGTDANKAVTPDALAGSTLGTKVVYLDVYPAGTGLPVESVLNAYRFLVPAELNSMNLVSAVALVPVQSTSGTPTFAINRTRSGTSVSMLSTNLTVDANEDSSYTAAVACVINSSNDDVLTGDWISFACTVAGTGTKGAAFILSFRLP